ncbi:MAG: RNA polymerase sigma factor [Egibacteraceae bacterium]
MTTGVHDSNVAGNRAEVTRSPQIVRHTAWARNGDAALLRALQAEGFAGPAWERFSDEAGAYGFQVLQGWIYTGQISVELARRKVRGIGELEVRRLRWDRDTAEELAVETAALGLVKFRDRVLVIGGWDPHRGASLKTFYVGQCVFCFPEVYQSWYAAEDRWLTQAELARADAALQPARLCDDPMVVLLNGESRRELFDAVPDRVNRSIIALRLEGYTHAEIGEMLGLSEAAVGQRWRRHSVRLAEVVQGLRERGRHD